MEKIRQSRRRRRLWGAIAVGATLLAAIAIVCFSVTSRPQFDFVPKYHTVSSNDLTATGY